MCYDQIYWNLEVFIHFDGFFCWLTQEDVLWIL
jgi:hypothetical protein